MPRSSKTFRIFVSSTFTDYVEERNALNQRVFPRLVEYCRSRGAQFQAVDLRWGISEEAGYDQKTVEICMEEIKKCKRLSPKPNFLMLIGDRYGWQPLPQKIKKHHFDQILHYYQDDEKKLKELTQWYRLDENAISAEYCLLPRKNEFLLGEFWYPIEEKIRTLLLEVTAKLNIHEYTYTLSATEQEIYEGLLTEQEAGKHVFSYIREISSSERLSDEEKRIYFDINEFGEYNFQSNEKLVQLKEKIKHAILPSHLSTYDISLQEGKVPEDYLETFCRDVYRDLKIMIENELDQLEEIGDEERAIGLHEKFQQDHARDFLGRKDVLQKLTRRIMENRDHCMTLLHGASGMGKTSMMAKLAEMLKVSKDHIVFFRSIGADAKLVSSYEILNSFYYELSNNLQLPYQEISEQQELMKELVHSLGQIRQKKIILLIDAIDQIRDTEPLKRFISLLKDEDIKVVLSTITDDPSYHQFAKIANPVIIQDLSIEEADEMLGIWLSQQKRTLQPFQKEYISRYTKNCTSPLYLKLVFERAKEWKSYTTRMVLGNDTQEMIRILFNSLVEEEHFGSRIVENSLGYLAASRYGLSEDEILGLLTDNEEVYEEFIVNSHHEPPVKKLPDVIWSRLYYALEPYLSEIEVYGSVLLRFYHRQIRDVAGEMYVTVDKYKDLSHYFAKPPAFQPSSMDGQKHGNLRKIMELPFHQLQSEDWDGLEKTLTNFHLIEGAFQGRIHANFITDYQMVLNQKGTEMDHRVIASFLQFIRENSAQLQRFPQLTFQTAINQPKESIVSAKAMDVSQGKLYFVQKLEQRTNDINQAITIIPSSPKEMISVVWPPEGNHLFTSTRDSIHLWNLFDGTEVASYSSSMEISHLELSRDGEWLAVGRKNHSVSLLTKDLYETGKEILVDSEIIQLAWSYDHQMIAIVEESLLTIWNVETGEMVNSIDSGSKHWRGCAWSRDQQRMLMVTLMEELLVIDLNTKSIINGPSHWGNVALSGFYHKQNRKIRCYWDDSENWAYTLSLGDITTWNLKQGWREDYSAFLNSHIDHDIYPEKDLVLTKNHSDIILWQLSNGKIIRSITDPEIDRTSIMSLSQKGTQIFVSLQDGTFKIYENSLASVREYDGKVPLYSTTSYSHFNYFIKKLLPFGNKEVKLHSNKMNNVYQNQLKHDVLLAQMKPKLDKIARGMTTTIEIWDRVQKQWAVITPRFMNGIYFLQWLNNNRILIGSRHSLQIMDENKYRIYWNYTNKKINIQAIAIHPNEEEFLIGESNGTLHLGNFSSRKLQRVGKVEGPVHTLIWENSGERVFFRAGDVLAVIKIRENAIRTIDWLTNFMKVDEEILHLEWSEDREILVIATNKGSILGVNLEESVVYFALDISDLLEDTMLFNIKLSYMNQTSILVVLFENKCVLIDTQSKKRVAMWLTETPVHDYRIMKKNDLVLYEGMNQKVTEIMLKL